MCILHSVGHLGVNQSTDVKLVQALLNENLGKLAPYAPLVVDGHCGKNTQDMIGEFQRRVVGMANPDKKVDPGGNTLKNLRAGISSGLTKDKLRGIMPQATPGLVDKYYDLLLSAMTKNQINSGLRIAHFLAQVGVECGDLHWQQELDSGEYLNGRAELGNTQPGDGPRFKGRGLLQLTGRSNYTAYGAARNRDFVSDPNPTLIATDPSLAVDSACWYWTTLKNLNPLADADNVQEITFRINGGYTDLPQRKQHLQRAKCLLVS